MSNFKLQTSNSVLKRNVSNGSFQHENHKSLPVSNEYVLDGLYPNTLSHIGLAAKSKRGEGAATPPIASRTEQYGMTPDRTKPFFSLGILATDSRLKGSGKVTKVKVLSSLLVR